MLNADQSKAAMERGHCLVVACPGSGKTTLVVSKISTIFEEVPNSRIVAVTFTRDAANSLKLSATRRFKNNPNLKVLPSQFVVGTFHALCIWQLTQAGKMGQLVKPREQREFMARAWKAVAPKNLELEDAEKIIETCKSALDYVPGDDVAGELYTAYADMMARNHVMDFQDVMLNCVRYMRSGEVQPIKCSHIMVDEFQDTDEVQYAWFMEHVKAGSMGTAVADDDQCIYSWRRAMGYEGMMRFAEETSARIITLGTNYRSHSEILNAAARVISQNVSRVDKSFHAHKGVGGALSIERVPSRKEEASAVAKRILEEYAHAPVDEETGMIQIADGQWAVLARTNRLLDDLEAALAINNLPCYRSGGSSLWNTKPVALYLALLRSILTGEKSGIDHALHGAGMTEEDIRTLHKCIGSRCHPLLHGDLSIAQKFSGEPALILETFITHAAKWRSNIEIGRSNQALSAAAGWMVKYASSPLEIKLLGIASDALCDMKGSFSERLDRVSLKDGKDKREKTGVALHTMHGAKGLEFKNVWIIACEESIIPNGKSPVDEERRLFFVAMTRAENRLIMSSALGSNKPSRFLKDAENGF